MEVMPTVRARADRPRGRVHEQLRGALGVLSLARDLPHRPARAQPRRRDLEAARRAAIRASTAPTPSRSGSTTPATGPGRSAATSTTTATRSTGTDPQEVPPGWDDWHVPVEHTEFQMYDYLLNENGELVDYGDAPADYQTDVYSDRAVEFIESAAAEDGPVLPLGDAAGAALRGRPRRVDAPAQPAPRAARRGRVRGAAVPGRRRSPRPTSRQAGPGARGPAKLAPGASPTPRWRASTAAGWRACSPWTGWWARSWRRCARPGELENTYVDLHLRQRLSPGRARPGRASTCVFEESIRVPLVIRGPGLPAGERRSEPVQNIDLAPTIVDARRASRRSG